MQKQTTQLQQNHRYTKTRNLQPQRWTRFPLLTKKSGYEEVWFKAVCL